jgi:mercuric reductase
MARHKYDFDLIVIGSGAGGSVAAHIAARAGKRVALVEAGAFGGECPNWGCVPTKALLHAANVYDAAKHGSQFGIRSAAIGYNYPSIKAWKDLAVKRTGADNSKKYHESDGINVIEGAAHFIDPHQITVNRRHYSAAHFLIATGSSWYVPDIDGLEKTGYLTAKTAIDLIRPPKSLFIIGAGAVGCEFAELFSVFGTKVYMADVAPRILPKEDSEVSEVLEDILVHKRGATLLPSSKVLRVSKEGLMKRVTFQRGGHEQSVKVDEILLASGKIANTDIGLENADVEYSARAIKVNEFLQTSAKHIYAAGDCTGGYMFTHIATHESRLAANNILHRDKIAVDYRAVPRVTFLTPEVASVGVSEEAARRRDLPIKTAIAPIRIIGRANVSDSRDGFVKDMTDKHGQLLGATIVSPSAGEMIHELTLAIQYGMLASDVAATIHAFPSWSEAIRVACGKI